MNVPKQPDVTAPLMVASIVIRKLRSPLVAGARHQMVKAGIRTSAYPDQHKWGEMDEVDRHRRCLNGHRIHAAGQVGACVAGLDGIEYPAVHHWRLVERTGRGELEDSEYEMCPFRSPGP